MEVKVQKDTKVTISMTETEAGKLKTALFNEVDFEKEGWAAELYDALDAHDIFEQPYEAV